MKYIELNEDNILAEIRKCIFEKIECVVAFKPTRDVVFGSLIDKFDEDYCKSNNIKVLHLLNMGGVIVSSAGDIQLGHFSKDTYNDFSTKLLEKIRDYLCSRGLNAVIHHNDILVDGYKVCGCASVIYDGIKYTVFQISINVNIENIKAICLKPMNKTPKGLMEFGVTKQDIENLIDGFEY